MSFEFAIRNNDIQIKLKDSNIVCDVIKNKGRHDEVVQLCDNFFAIYDSIYKIDENFKCVKIQQNIHEPLRRCYLSGYSCYMEGKAVSIYKLIFDGTKFHEEPFKRFKCFNLIGVTNKYIVYLYNDKIHVYDPIVGSATFLDYNDQFFYHCLSNNVLFVKDERIAKFITIPDGKELPYALKLSVGDLFGYNVSNNLFQVFHGSSISLLPAVYYYDDEKLTRLKDDWDLLYYIPYSKEVWQKYTKELIKHIHLDIVKGIILPFL